MATVIKEDIETVIDRLVDYIKVNHSVSAAQAAKALGLKPIQVENLALLMEQSGLVEVKYTISGVVLSDKAITEQKKEAPKKAQIALEKSVGAKAEKFGKGVQLSEDLLKFFEKDIERRMEESDALLNEIDRGEGYSAADLDQVRRAIESATAQLELFTKELDRLHVRESEFYDKVFRFKTKIEGMEKRQVESAKSAAPMAQGMAAINPFARNDSQGPKPTPLMNAPMAAPKPMPIAADAVPHLPTSNSPKMPSMPAMPSFSGLKLPQMKPIEFPKLSMPQASAPSKPPEPSASAGKAGLPRMKK